jgi:hypothetical protein
MAPCRCCRDNQHDFSVHTLREDLQVHLASQIIETALVVVHHHPQTLQQRLLQIITSRTILLNLVFPVLDRRRVALGPAAHVGEVVIYRSGERAVGALDDEGGERAQAEAGAEVGLGSVDECYPAAKRMISVSVDSEAERAYHRCDLDGWNTRSQCTPLAQEAVDSLNATLHDHLHEIDDLLGHTSSGRFRRL